MNSHEIDYKILGNDIQMVEVELDPQETVIAEAGTMVYMDEAMKFETKMGDGSEANQGLFSKLLSAGSRVLTGESLFLATLRGTGSVWLQSMPIRKLIQVLAPYGRNSGKGNQSILGQFLER